MAHQNKRSWACRLAERWAAKESQGLDEPGRGRLSILSRWARRHTGRCPHCRAEAVELGRVERLLRQVDGPAAPPQLYGAVMARVAASPRHRSQVGIGHGGTRWIPSATGSERVALPLAVSAVLVGCLLMGVAGSVGLVLLQQAFGTVWFGVIVGWQHWMGALMALQADFGTVWASLTSALPNLSTHVRPYMSSLLWSGVGLAVTLVAARGPRRLRN